MQVLPHSRKPPTNTGMRAFYAARKQKSRVGRWRGSFVIPVTITLLHGGELNHATVSRRDRHRVAGFPDATWKRRRFARALSPRGLSRGMADLRIGGRETT